MDLFNENALAKLIKEDDKNIMFKEQEQKISVISMSDSGSSLAELLKVKLLFQRMLPKMPREYIMRQVYDPKQCSMVLSDKNNRIIGAICYRPVFSRTFVEIVFFAVDSEYHISGYGTFLFNCFKQLCKKQCDIFNEVGDEFNKKNMEINDLEILNNSHEWSESSNLGNKINDNNQKYENDQKCNKIQDSENNDQKYNNIQDNENKTLRKSIYLLTYADNSAIGFFKKQGFSLNPVSSDWIGYIKDYDGGTLMECKIHQSVNYLKKKELIENVRNLIFERMKSINNYHILRRGDDREDIARKYGYIDEHSNYVVRSLNRTADEFLYNFLFYLICSLQANSSAWPFLEPVNTKDVPDYLDVIRHPMDLSTISNKHKNLQYSNLAEFTNDIYLMVNNCLKYNSPETQYYKCGENIKRAYEAELEKYSDIIQMWGV